MSSELDVLMEQVGELLAEWPTEPEEALELAGIAGMAARLGPPDGALAEAEAWRDDSADALIEEAWTSLDLEVLLEALDAVCSGDATEEAVEEALFDLDELIAAAIWTGQTHRVRAAATQIARTVRDVPEVFATLADFGATLAALPDVATHLDVYDFWVAVAQAGAWSDDA